MSSTVRKTTGLLGAFALAFSVVVSGPAYAAQAATPPSDEEPDRVIHVDGPVPEPDSSAKVIQADSDVTVTVTEPEDLPVVPEPGETVRIVYTNAVTEITTDPIDDSAEASAAAACTKSLTAYTPYKTTYPQARAKEAGRSAVGAAVARRSASTFTPAGR